MGGGQLGLAGRVRRKADRHDVLALAQRGLGAELERPKAGEPGDAQHGEVLAGRDAHGDRIAQAGLVAHLEARATVDDVRVGDDQALLGVQYPAGSALDHAIAVDRLHHDRARPRALDSLRHRAGAVVAQEDDGGHADDEEERAAMNPVRRIERSTRRR